MSPRVFALFAVLMVACSSMNTEVAATEKEVTVVDAKSLLEFMGKALEVIFVFCTIALKMNCVLYHWYKHLYSLSIFRSNSNLPIFGVVCKAMINLIQFLAHTPKGRQLQATTFCFDGKRCILHVHV